MLRLDADVAGALVKRMRLGADDVAANRQNGCALGGGPSLAGRHQPLCPPSAPVRLIDDEAEDLVVDIGLEQRTLAHVDPPDGTSRRIARHEHELFWIVENSTETPRHVLPRRRISQLRRQRSDGIRIRLDRDSYLVHSGRFAPSLSGGNLGSWPS